MTPCRRWGCAPHPGPRLDRRGRHPCRHPDGPRLPEPQPTRRGGHRRFDGRHRRHRLGWLLHRAAARGCRVLQRPRTHPGLGLVAGARRPVARLPAEGDRGRGHPAGGLGARDARPHGRHPGARGHLARREAQHPGRDAADQPEPRERALRPDLPAAPARHPGCPRDGGPVGTRPGDARRPAGDVAQHRGRGRDRYGRLVRGATAPGPGLEPPRRRRRRQRRPACRSQREYDPLGPHRPGGLHPRVRSGPDRGIERPQDRGDLGTCDGHARHLHGGVAERVRGGRDPGSRVDLLGFRGRAGDEPPRRHRLRQPARRSSAWATPSAKSPRRRRRGSASSWCSSPCCSP